MNVIELEVVGSQVWATKGQVLQRCLIKAQSDTTI
jgi:hypothetical protein